MSYVDGFVVPVPRKNLAAYRRMAQKAGKVWKEYGALEYKEWISDDVKVGQAHLVPAERQAQARRNRGLRVHRVQVARASRSGEQEGHEGPAAGRHDGSEVDAFRRQAPDLRRVQEAGLRLSGRAAQSTHEGPQPATINVDDTHRVSGLLQTPPRGARLLRHGARRRRGYGASVHAGDGERTRREAASPRSAISFPYMELGSKRPDTPKLAQATVARQWRKRLAWCRTLPFRGWKILRRPHDFTGSSRVALVRRPRVGVPRISAPSGRPAVGRRAERTSSTCKFRCCSCRERAISSRTCRCCKRSWESSGRAPRSSSSRMPIIRFTSRRARDARTRKSWPKCRRRWRTGSSWRSLASPSRKADSWSEKMTEEKILTKHPLGKSGRNISKQKYQTIKQALVGALRNKELTHAELLSQVNQKLEGQIFRQHKLVCGDRQTGSGS